MPSFQAAWECGTPWIEADVQPTLDNVPVMLHDDDLDRTTDGTGPLRRRSAAEVTSLDAGSWFTKDGTDAERNRYRGTRVPLLAELLDTLDQHRSLLLEIKGEHTRGQVQAEMAVVRASGWDDRVLLESFEIDALEHVMSIQPGRPVGLLVDQLHEDPVAACAALGAISYNPRHSLLRDRPDLVQTLHAADIAVFVWTADDPADWEFLTGIGVDGIITNTPGQLMAWQRGRAEGGGSTGSIRA
jgi:glycerophosphoryl diester phosphodiesterase